MAMSTNYEIQTDANNRTASGVVVPNTGVVGALGGQVRLDSARNQFAALVVVRAPVILLGPATAATLNSPITGAGNTSPIDASDFEMLAVDLSVTVVGGSASPTLTMFLERQMSDGATWAAIWSPTAITATGVTSTSIGPGLATNAIWGQFIRLRWTISGTNPSFTLVGSIYGK